MRQNRSKLKEKNIASKERKAVSGSKGEKGKPGSFTMTEKSIYWASAILQERNKINDRVKGSTDT